MLKYNDLPIQSKNIRCHHAQFVTKSSHSELEDLIRSNGIMSGHNVSKNTACAMATSS